MKASFHIRSDNFNPANSVLLMIIGNRNCSFAVMNYPSKELIEYGHYVANQENEDLKDFFNDTDTLNTRYYQAAIAFDAEETLQIPASVYKYEDGPLLLDTVHGRSVHTKVASENVPGWNLYNVYRVPESLQSAVAWKFLSGKFWNIYSVLLKNYSHNKNDCLLADFKADEFLLLVIKENKLLLAKTFAYSSPEDVVYYLIKASLQSELSRHSVKLSLSGLIEKDSAIYRELYKYFIHVEFESLPGEIKIAEALQVNPHHYYSNISKLATCVS